MMEVEDGRHRAVRHLAVVCRQIQSDHYPCPLGAAGTSTAAVAATVKHSYFIYYLLYL